MKKIILIITLIVLLPSFSFAEPVDKRWSENDMYLFTALISSQIADYSQSMKFNSTITKNECGMLDTPQFYDAGNGVSGMTWYECKDRQYLLGDEKNPLVRRGDGGFDESKALLFGAGLDVGLFYIGTKYPSWRRPLLYLVYAIEMIAINNNHSKGFSADTPILPVFITFNF